MRLSGTEAGEFSAGVLDQLGAGPMYQPETDDIESFCQSSDSSDLPTCTSGKASITSQSEPEGSYASLGIVFEAWKTVM